MSTTYVTQDGGYPRTYAAHQTYQIEGYFKLCNVLRRLVPNFAQITFLLKQRFTIKTDDDKFKADI